MSEEIFKKLAILYTGVERLTKATQERIINDHFGCSPLLMYIAWNLIKKKQTISDIAHPKHLVWTLYYLKQNPLQTVGAIFCKADKGTFKKWRNYFIEKLANMDIVSTRRTKILSFYFFHIFFV